MSTDEKMSNWCCDGCTRQLKHGEFRYNCTVCSNFDYCEDCYQNTAMLHPHRLIKEQAFSPAKEIECTEVTIECFIRIDPTDPSIYKDTYSWLTFRQVGDRIKSFGNGLRHLVEARTTVAICAQNRPEWIITDFACILYRLITVPIYCCFTNSEILHVLNNSAASILVCDGSMFSRCQKIVEECQTIQHLICMDSFEQSIREYTSKFEVELTSTSVDSGFPQSVRDMMSPR
jgi:hypothetical protein